ncbi:sugar phosphate isomerase/epimerase (plasmid) [Phaeobacter sp. BS23]|uniref:sugar phosphate isomerase/epimerase family protein n=1 Tax=Phaeobacter sp. BS23 TaxID=2907239 RepID=UPI003703FA00
MIHPGFITDELTQSYDLAARIAVEMDARHLEVRTFDDKAPIDISIEDLREINKINHEHGITVQVFCSPFGKMSMPKNDAEIDAYARELAAEVARAQSVQAKFMRIFPFERDGAFDLDGAAQAYAQIFERVELPPGLLLFENGTISNAPSLELLAGFLDRLKRLSPRVETMDIGLLWDPGNAYFSECPDDLSSASVRDALPLVRHVHIKDFADGAYVSLGEGELEWSLILTLLRNAGFSGAASLETHARVGRVLTKPLRDQPWAQEFTDGGFVPTMQSLIALRELLDHPGT